MEQTDTKMVFLCVVNVLFVCFSLNLNFFLSFLLAVVDFSIQVLSSGSWPFQQSIDFNLPTEVCLQLSVCKSLTFSHA